MTQFSENLNQDAAGIKTTAIVENGDWLTPVKIVSDPVQFINQGAVNLGKRRPIKATATLNSVADVPYGTKFTLATVPSNKLWLIATVEGGSAAGVTFDDILLNNVGIGFFLGPSSYNTKYLSQYFGGMIPLQTGQKIELMYHTDSTGPAEQYISYYGWEIDLT